ncbi:MAG: MBL fold metallo-hydrolase [Clostridia bacterium]|nr:MBL fold metallo-hydrolase [Clostridia bacterium]
MEVKRLDTGYMGTNTYVLYGEAPESCIVIDPADDQPVLAFMAQEGLRCTHILLTHTHFDHIMGVARLKAATGALVCAHEADAPGLHDPKISLSNMISRDVEPSEADVLFQDGDTLEAAGFTLRVLHTPGHSAGGVCYVVEQPRKVIFAGDTLFYRSVGRTDMPNCSQNDLISSIQNKLFTLEGDYLVFPGHGPATRLCDERTGNPYASPRSRA